MEYTRWFNIAAHNGFHLADTLKEFRKQVIVHVNPLD